MNGMSTTCPRCGSPLLEAGSGPAVCPRCILGDASHSPGESYDPFTSIAGYRLIRRLGEGGMGVVHLAEEIDPPHRTVALKVIKAGFDTGEVLARFKREQHSLSRMDHPCIAKVLGAGETDQGLPYFAMEFVDGDPITTYCDRNALTNAERLRLFVRVCDGAQHAHQKGVVHRDLKPSNILVAQAEGGPVPKIIDFGVAKATGHEAIALTFFTEKGMLIGTPEYMSPEQAGLAPDDVDTRADVYALGMVLYELLAGSLPFDPRELRKAGLDEIRRWIREVDAPRLSARVRTLGDASLAAARNRRTDPHRLAGELKGDLDWIAMKALEKDRERRYGSANELAADVSRYLDGAAIIARPPSALYRIRKTVLRHKAPFTVAAAILVLLTATAVITTVQARHIAREKTRADREAETARRTAAFLMSLFEVSDPTSGEGKSISAREILDRGARDVRQQLKDEPETRAQMLDTIGMVYRSLGLYADAEPYLREALDISKKEWGDSSPEAGSRTLHVGLLLFDMGKLDDAEPLLRQGLDIARHAEGEESASAGECTAELGRLLYHKGKLADAEALLLRAKAIQEKTLGPDNQEVAKTVNSLGMLYDDQGKRHEAESMYERSMAIDEKTLGEDNPSRAVVYANLAELYRGEGRYSDAEPLYLKALAIFQKTLDPGDAHIATIDNNLGLLYRAEKRYPEAERAYKQCKDILLKALPADHPDIVTMTNNIGVLKLMEGDLRGAEPLLEEALSKRQRIFHGDHPKVAESLFNLAMLREEQHRFGDAVPLYDQALAMNQRVYGVRHAAVAKTMERYAGMLRKMGREQQAGALEAQARVIHEASAATTGKP